MFWFYVHHTLSPFINNIYWLQETPEVNRSYRLKCLQLLKNYSFEEQIVAWKASSVSLCFVGSMKWHPTLLRLPPHFLIFFKDSLTNVCCRTCLFSMNCYFTVAKYAGRYLWFSDCWSSQAPCKDAPFSSVNSQVTKSRLHQDTPTLVFSLVSASIFLVFMQFSISEALLILVASWSNMQDAQSRGWVLVLNMPFYVEYTGVITHDMRYRSQSSEHGRRTCLTEVKGMLG